MGIMPNTAKALGVTPHELKNPDTGIRTGVDCLRRFRQGFGKITDPVEKIKFTLAAYNAGIGHIYDAQRLAEKYGKDPYVWDDNVAEYIRMKNDPEYYNDPVCKHGYLRGSETFNYVREVMERYNYYLHKTGKKIKRCVLLITNGTLLLGTNRTILFSRPDIFFYHLLNKQHHLRMAQWDAVQNLFYFIRAD